MKVLIAEDDTEVGAYVQRSLAAEGNDVDLISDGGQALSLALAGGHDLLILDRMMPTRDGLSILKSVRSAGLTAPAILLTAMDSIEDRVEGLRAGADDYIVKPFALVELLARIDNIFRRPARLASPMELTVGDMKLDLLQRSAQRGGQFIELQTREFLLLKHFMERPGLVQTRTVLLEAVWGLTFDPKTSVVETHVSRLRNKIDRPFDEPYLMTLHGIGYVFKP